MGFPVDGDKKATCNPCASYRTFVQDERLVHIKYQFFFALK
jgi:hypothetical protein